MKLATHMHPELRLAFHYHVPPSTAYLNVRYEIRVIKYRVILQEMKLLHTFSVIYSHMPTKVIVQSNHQTSNSFPVTETVRYILLDLPLFILVDA